VHSRHPALVHHSIILAALMPLASVAARIGGRVRGLAAPA